MSSSVVVAGADMGTGSPGSCTPGLFDTAVIARPTARGATGQEALRRPGQRPSGARGSVHSRASGLEPRERRPEVANSGGRPLPPVPQAARDLLADASRGLGRAIRATEADDRYAAAHLAALRAAAAVLAARARPVRGRRGSAWELMSRVAPEFTEWAAFFAAGSAKRQAAEAGLQRLVTPREADDMVRQVATFLDLVDDFLSAA